LLGNTETRKNVTVYTRYNVRICHKEHGESPIRGVAQNSAYMAQTSTKVAQNSRCFTPVKIPWEHLHPPECHGVHTAQCQNLPQGAWHKVRHIRHKTAQK